MIKDAAKITGRLLVELWGPSGELKERREVNNLVVTAGLTLIANALATGTETAMTHMAVGTDATAAALGQTALIAELARVALGSTTPSGPVVTYVAAFPAGTGTGALVEAGIFNATPAGTMLARTTFTVVNKGASDTITITWTITLG